MWLLLVMSLVLSTEGHMFNPDDGIEHLSTHEHRQVDEGLSYYLKNDEQKGFVLDSCCIFSEKELVYSCKGCGLRDVPSAENIPIMTKFVDLSCNFITEIPTNLFGGRPFPYLTAIDFTNNLIHTVHQEAFRFLELTQLYLSGNNLTSVPKYLPTSLKRLGLLGNYIEEVNQDSFSAQCTCCNDTLNITEIHNVYFTADNSTDNCTCCDAGNSSLSYLSISSRKLGYGAFSNLPNLEEVTIETCHIERLAFLRFPVTHLWLRNACPAYLDDGYPGLALDHYAFAGFPGKVMGIVDTTVEEVPWRAFAEMYNLDALYLSGINTHQFNQGSFFMLPNLQSLHVTNNPPSNLHVVLKEGIFEEGLTILKEVWFSNLGVASVDPYIFNMLPRLSYLSLSSNGLTNLAENVLKPLENNLGLINLSFNPWKCDCDLHWLIEFLQSHLEKLMNPDYTVCSSPHHLIGHRLDELSLDDLGCDIEPNSTWWRY